MEYPIHPVALLFPEIGADDFVALVADIEAHGLREDILVYEGKVIDGRSRLRACQEAGVTPRFKEWEGEGSLVELALSLNLRRRHLTSAQRAAVSLVAKEMLAKEASARERSGKSADGRAGGRGRKASNKNPEARVPQGLGSQKAEVNKVTDEPCTRAKQSRDRAAELLNVSPRAVQDAAAIAKASPEKLAEVRDGKVSLAQAKRDLGLAPKPDEEPWCIEHDIAKFHALRDKLKDRWTGWREQTAMRDCFRVMANDAVGMTIEGLAADRARAAAEKAEKAKVEEAAK